MLFIIMLLYFGSYNDKNELAVKHNCEIYHNRDKNAVQNMLKIVKSIFNTGKRPEVFCRSC